MERIAQAEAFVANTKAEVRYGGNRAYYTATGDYIQLPPFEAFRDGAGYYSTLGHEATHWSGAKSRLNRDIANRFGSSAYAAEELIAELGAAFLCSALKLSNEPRVDHASYVAHWLELLRRDKRAIFAAASKAQQAVDWMQSRQNESAESSAEAIGRAER